MPSPGAGGARHFALNVYCWGEREQDRLLTECIAPAARALWDEASLCRFWVHRFDVRGPHVMVLFGAPAGHAAEAARRLVERVEAHLAAAPSKAELAPDLLRERHEACRGARLCSADAIEGLAPNNSYHLADHEAGGHLFGDMPRTPRPDEVERALGELAFGSLDEIGRGGAARRGIRWAAALDDALLRAGAAPGEFWRYYASTLLPPLRASILAGDPEIVASLPSLIGESNRALFARAGAGAAEPGWPGLQRVVAATACAPTPPLPFLRDLTHDVFAQLGLPVMFRIPIALQSWLRHIPVPLTA